MSHCCVGGSCRECEEAENNKIKTEKKKNVLNTEINKVNAQYAGGVSGKCQTRLAWLL